MKALRIIGAWMALLGWVFGLFYGLGWITTHPATPFWIGVMGATLVTGIIGIIGFIVLFVYTLNSMEK